MDALKSEKNYTNSADNPILLNCGDFNQTDLITAKSPW